MKGSEADAARPRAGVRLVTCVGIGVREWMRGVPTQSLLSVVGYEEAALVNDNG